MKKNIAVLLLFVFSVGILLLLKVDTSTHANSVVNFYPHSTNLKQFDRNENFAQHLTQQETKQGLRLSSNISTSALVSPSISSLHADYPYLYFLLGQNLVVLDVTNLTQPQKISQLEFSNSATLNLVVVGSHAYLSDGQYFYVVNISSPHTPFLQSTIPMEGFVRAVDQGYAILASGGSPGTNGTVQFIDVSNPSSPFLVGTYDSLGFAVGGIDAVNSKAYIANGWSGLRVLDFSTPTTPVGSGGYSDFNNLEWASDVVIEGNFAFLADSGAVGVIDGGLHVFDISSQNNPQILTALKGSGYSFRLLTIQNNHVFVLDNNMIRIIQIVNPTNPVEIGLIDAIEVRTFDVEGEYAYIGDFDGVIHIYHIGDPTNPYEVGNYSIKCFGADSGVQPLLMVTGWGGSEPSAIEDGQLRYFFGEDGHLASHDYVEGCNLFYAQDTSPNEWLAENGKIIHDNLCQAYTQVKAFNPGWDGHFDIIAHSYGGLRARAYLENNELYESVCPNTQNRVFVDNLFTMGTPHGGEPYPTGLPGDMLPLASYIGMKGALGAELPALFEMLPQTRLVQNLSRSQPIGTCYYLLSGDVRQQSNLFLQATLFVLTQGFPSTSQTANDLAVHDSSATILNSLLFSWKYPNTEPVNTIDLHGQLPWDDSTAPSLRSFVNPNTTFVEEILPHIGKHDCFSPSSWPIVSTMQTPAQILGQQTDAQTTSGIAMIDITTGSLVDNESVSGDFTLNGTGSSQIRLSWLSGNLSLSLIDPDGNEINPPTAETDANVDFLSMDTGLGLMATYLFSDTVSGTWQYTITGNEVNLATAYSLIALPPTPISVSPSLPQWLPNSTPTIITATVSYSNTMPVVGGEVSAQIRQPDGITDTISLLDDGAHYDGLANDGIFGEVYPQTSKGGIYGLLFTATGVYESEVYTRTATAYLTIAPSGASLNDSYSDKGVDDTGDGIYEWLEVSADINVTEATTYTLSADLYAGNTFITHARKQVYLDVGQQSIAVLFNGSAIFDQGLDGPYTVRNVMLLDETSVTLLIEDADEVHTTQAYQYTDFGRYLIYLPATMR